MNKRVILALVSILLTSSVIAGSSTFTEFYINESPIKEKNKISLQDFFIPLAIIILFILLYFLLKKNKKKVKRK